MNRCFPKTAIALACTLAFTPLAVTAQDTTADSLVVINVDNFNKAQTDHEFAGILNEINLMMTKATLAFKKLS